MNGAGRLRGARRGAAGGGSAFLAVAIALLVVGCDLPRGEGMQDQTASPGPFALPQVLEAERAWIDRTAALSWGALPPDLTDAHLRARLAAQGALDALTQRYPRNEGSLTVSLDDRLVSTPDAPSERLPAELSLRISGLLRASSGALGERTLAFDVSSPDPTLPRGLQYLDARLAEQAGDPRSVSAAAVRLAVFSSGALLSPLPEGALELGLNAALSQAGNRLESELGSPGVTEGAGSPLPATAEADVGEEATADAEELAAVSPDLFAAFVKAFLEGMTGSPAARALAAALAWVNGSLLPSARALLRGDVGPLRAMLQALPLSLVPSVAEASMLLHGASTALILELHQAAARAAQALRQFAPALPRVWPGASGVQVSLSASEVHLATSFTAPAAITADGALVPAIAAATIEFTLQSSVRLREFGRWVEASRQDAFRLTMPFVATAGERPQAQGGAGPAGPLGSRAAELAGPLSSAVGLLEILRGEIDQRLLTFRDAVSGRIAESAAGGLARLALRVLDGLSSNDGALAARALFELMERYFADDLRNALTLNFSLYGVNFTLVPDPVRQQVTLEHSEGPHTFGVRVRRVYSPDNPFVPKFNDHLSLALELIWRYDASPVFASITLDPLLRTDDGLLRFSLRVEQGDGLQLTAVAPRVIRRAGTWELAVSDFVPGGIPLAPTPSGGLITLDAGARIEFGGAALASPLRTVLRAIERALFDSLENQTVGEVADQMSALALSRRFLERFVERLADTFADEASRLVLRCEAFVRLRWMEAAGVVSASLELGLALEEPVTVFRQIASDVGRLVRASLDGILLSNAAPFRPLDFLPTAVHERIGPAVKLSIRGGLDGVPLVGRLLSFLPHAEVEQSLFLSLGALAAAAGRRAVHWLSDFALGFEGFSLRPAALFPYRLAAGDTLEAVHLRAESLSGPRVLISEVLPSPSGHDSDLEFVEIYNPSPAEEDLTGWTLTDSTGHAFRLPDGTRIGPGATLVLSRSALAFFERFAFAAQVPTLTLSLNDDGDRLRLANPRGWTSDEVAWGALAPSRPAPRPDESLARAKAPASQAELPFSVLRFTGYASDFVLSAPTPGTIA